jgi:hypothetical protein
MDNLENPMRSSIKNINKGNISPEFINKDAE